jgi:hypothetical protein
MVVVVVAVVEHDTQMALRPVVLPRIATESARGCAHYLLLPTMQPTLNKNVNQSAQRL